MKIPLLQLIRREDASMHVRRLSWFDRVGFAIPIIMYVGCYISLYWAGRIGELPPNWQFIVIGFLALSAPFFCSRSLIDLRSRIRNLCQIERREELSLTQLDPKEWLRANLYRPLCLLLAIPISNLVIVVPLGFFWCLLLSYRQGAFFYKDTDAAPLLIFFVAAYFLIYIQVGTICLTLMGVSNLITLYCVEKKRPLAAALAPFGWGLMIFFSPIAVILSGALTLGFTTAVLPGLLCIYLPRRVRSYWQKAAESYFNFD